jgi:tRNA(Met) C34 N-acetyltransferase TmcA
LYLNVVPHKNVFPDKDSHKVLGNTFGMLVLQDFESITPNVLARTIETVEGGGCVLLLLKVRSSINNACFIHLLNFLSRPCPH